VHVEELATHGGSYRYWIVPHSSRIPDAFVAGAIERELRGGLLAPGTWRTFADRSRATIAGPRAWLDERAARLLPFAAAP
jgi:hypothetical protein